MATAIFAVIVASVCCETARMSGGNRGTNSQTKSQSYGAKIHVGPRLSVDFRKRGGQHFRDRMVCEFPPVAIG
jgi:hypothetical protein